MGERYEWRSNAGVTRMHACEWKPGWQAWSARCGLKIPAGVAEVSGVKPPRCKRCERKVNRG